MRDMLLSKRKLIILLASVILAAAVTIYQYSYFRAMTRKEPEVQVLTAGEDIHAGERIDDSVAIKSIPRSAFVESMMVPGEGVSGYAGVDIEKGAYLMKNMISPERVPVVEEGMRRITIMVNLASGLAGSIKPGDYVDVGFVPGNDDEKEGAVIAASRVQVYAVVNGRGEDIHGRDDNRKNRYERESTVPAAVTLVVTLEQGVRLKELESKGTLFLMGY